MKCSQCQREAIQNSTLCSECESSLHNKCSNCETELPLSAKFCLECGKDIRKHPSTPLLFPSPRSYTPQYLANKILQSRSSVMGERKHVTVLFCDLVGSSALATQLGQEAMHVLLNKFFELAVGEVHRYEGTLNQFLGDGFMALFGAPLACEDHSHRAALTAIGIQQAIMEKGYCNSYARGQQVSIRFGINTGPVVVGSIGDDLRMDYTAIGDTTNLAAALEAMAEPGKIFLSHQTYRKIEGQFECIEIKTRFPKSKGEFASVYQLEREKSSQEMEKSWPKRNNNSPLIGRDEQLGTLITCLEQVLEGKGGIAFVIGEPGIGKSRLVAEARTHLSDAGILWLEGRGFSHSQTSSYGLIVDLIKSYAGIVEHDRDPKVWRKLEQRITGLFPEEGPEILPYLAALLSFNLTEKFQNRIKYLNSEDMGRHIFRTSRRFFERLAQEQPLVLLFEDMHWSDESSMKLLEHLLPLTKTSPLFICCISRPDLNQSSQDLRAVLNKSYATSYTEVRLSPLSMTEGHQVVSNLLGNNLLPNLVQKVMVTKAGGNPFFLEEVVRSLIDTGILKNMQGIEDWLAAKRIDEIDLPESIHEVIMARVDRLPEDIKHILKLASVIGRSFLYRVLYNLALSKEELERSLTTLKDRGFIKEKKHIPELEFFFQHALVQEAVYDSILQSRRLELHRQVAECIESVYADRKDEFNGLLAYHYARAQEEQPALHYLLKAGDQAGQIAADAEALTHYNQAMETAIRVFGSCWDPTQRATLERKIGEALFRRGKHGEAKDHLYQALTSLGISYPTSIQEVRRSIFKQLIIQIWHRLWTDQAALAPKEQVNFIAEECSLIYEALIWIDFFVDPKRFILDSLLELNLSERHNLPIGIVQGGFTLGLVLDVIPIQKFAEYYHRRNVFLSKEIAHPRAKGHAFLGLGIHEHYQGNPTEAIKHLELAASAYQDAGALRGLSASKGRISRIFGYLGDFTNSSKVSQQVIRLGEDSGDRQAEAWGLALEGFTKRQTGEVESAIILFKRTLVLCPEIPDWQTLASVLANLGICYLYQNQLPLAKEQRIRSQNLIRKRGLRGTQITDAFNHSANIILAETEQAPEKFRAQVLEEAQKACDDALKQCKVDPWGAPGAYRNQGTFIWICGDPVKAMEWWNRSLHAGNSLGMRYEIGLTTLEIGMRKNDPSQVLRAKIAFEEVGAMSYFNLIQKGWIEHPRTPSIISS